MHVDQVKNGQQNYNLTGDLFFQVLVGLQNFAAAFCVLKTRDEEAAF